MNSDETVRLKDAALNHLWMHNRDWTEAAEEGGPLVVSTGHGIRVTDTDGKSWIDVNGGYSSVNVGFGRLEIAEAVNEQMHRITYFPQRTTTAPTALLAEKLAEITPGSLSRVFPVSGGSEANETSLKIARAYHNRRGEPERNKIISRMGSYHGATGGVLWLGGTDANSRCDYKPANPGFLYAPHPDPTRCELGGETPSECAVRCAEAVDKLIVENNPSTVAAVIAEPVANGIVPGDEYWPILREICDRHGVLLIADEVVTGFGRTGKMFGVDNWGVVPDIMSLGKGIVSSYLPIGASVVTEEVANHFVGKGNHFRHVFTFSGHPVSAAASLKNIEIIENESLVDNALEVGTYFKEQLEGLVVDHPLVGPVQGLGLILRMEIDISRVELADPLTHEAVSRKLNDCFTKHSLILALYGDALIFGPPLCITKQDVDEIVHAIDLSLWEVEGDLGIAQIG
ncbi:MAG: aspartate aminotransferase family protein [SAR202 cluster bacterium]|nr:aspartate aminotransferase family protein [SAR202 cluster bacterium]